MPSSGESCAARQTGETETRPNEHPPKHTHSDDARHNERGQTESESIVNIAKETNKNETTNIVFNYSDIDLDENMTKVLNHGLHFFSNLHLLILQKCKWIIKSLKEL